MKFVPIDGDATGWHHGREDGVRVFDHNDQQQIEAILMGRKVVKADEEHLVLDNGTVVKAIGHEGGCSCGAGDYDLSVLNGVDNVITRVEFDYQPAGDDSDGDGDGFYRVFVFADAQQINLMQFDGTDGNGYYGTGFEILVRPPEATP